MTSIEKHCTQRSLSLKIPNSCEKCGLVALIIALPLPAQAVEPRDMFVGLHYGAAELNNRRFDSLSPEVLFVSVGYQFSQIIAAEGRIGIGAELVNDIDQHELDNLFGLYLRAHLPPNRPLSLYGIAGYGQVKYTVAGSNHTASKGFSLGGGVAYRRGDHAEFVMETLHINDDDRFDLDTYSVGFRFYY